ncbi:uncharacterized protein LOC107667083 [Sinocyclocheilus anshuiensis]|uniref:uncharacterized protein LOC107667083 n=1 Tax=Sinocyclocheilus anshuiensis TaxID=1608454 RepID=UPI0007B969BF|nr:PREDICTED: uncharacterized protein LOC107667083 [Sinocyclocheilus anshuiensis]
MNSLNQDSHPFCEIIKKSVLIEDRNPACYHLQTSIENSDQSEPYRKMVFGERYKNKPHKTILMVGETGTGKTTLINTMINYMLGVQRKDKVWFEITDDQSDRTSVHSQTSRITVYGFYLQESPIDLTIIDTPGYADTRTNNLDKEIANSFLRLSESAEGIHEIDAVCLVIRAYQNRLPERQRYIFDAVQSLFGRDIAVNILLLFTHSTGTQPKNALTAVKEAEIKCAVNDKNQPVFFLFNNCQTDTADEESEMIWEQSWDHSSSRMEQFFTFLDKMKPKTLKMTRDVLRKWEQLEAKIPDLNSCVQLMELKQDELKHTQEALEKNKNYVIYLMSFDSEAEVPNKVNVNIDPNITKGLMYCKLCEQPCPESRMSKGIWQTIRGNNHCTVCPNKCHIDNHTKEPKIPEPKTTKEKNTNTDLKMEYDGKVKDGESLVKKLNNELHKLEKKKIKLVFDAFHCVDTLQIIAHNTDSLITLQHLDFLIEKLKEINELEKAKTLEDIKKAREDKHRAVEYITRD